MPQPSPTTAARSLATLSDVSRDRVECLLPFVSRRRVLRRGWGGACSEYSCKVNARGWTCLMLAEETQTAASDIACDYFRHTHTQKLLASRLRPQPHPRLVWMSVHQPHFKLLLECFVLPRLLCPRPPHHPPQWRPELLFGWRLCRRHLCRGFLCRHSLLSLHRLPLPVGHGPSLGWWAVFFLLRIQLTSPESQLKFTFGEIRLQFQVESGRLTRDNRDF